MARALPRDGTLRGPAEGQSAAVRQRPRLWPQCRNQAVREAAVRPPRLFCSGGDGLLAAGADAGRAHVAARGWH
eukprot:5611386-Prymnesium_polylepis.1